MLLACQGTRALIDDDSRGLELPPTIVLVNVTHSEEQAPETSCDVEINSVSRVTRIS